MSQMTTPNLIYIMETSSNYSTRAGSRENIRNYPKKINQIFFPPLHLLLTKEKFGQS